MHGSSSTSMRPRQRTFTSCTECRRRKQRCNQAKDRPCNNCSRRYPPVVCTYESSSPPPSHDRIVDLRDGQVEGSHYQDNPQQGGSRTPNDSSSYQQQSHTQSHPGYLPPTTSSSENYYNASTSTYGYHSPPVRNDYRGFQSNDMASTGGYVGTPTSTSGDYFHADNDGYFGSDQHLGYGVQGGVGGGHDFYAASSGSAQGDWLVSSTSDPFVGTPQGVDYFYVCDDGNTMPRTTRS